MQLSNQALGAIMMALQESLLNELDIVSILRGFKLIETDQGLMVENKVPRNSNSFSRH
jgi:hypothetical protein